MWPLSQVLIDAQTGHRPKTTYKRDGPHNWKLGELRIEGSHRRAYCFS